MSDDVIVDERNCSDCGCDARDESRETPGGDPLCGSCQTCADCDTDCHRNDYSNTDGDRICEACSDNYRWSNTMDRTIALEDAIWLSDSEDYVTEGYAQRNCWYNDNREEWTAEPIEEEEEEESALFEYDEDVLRHVQYDRTAVSAGAFVLGVELELEPKHGITTGEVIAALGGKLTDTHILKYDGSVPNGVELVTAPMTLAEHRGGRMNWPAVLGKVRGIGQSGAGTDRCGMHVHVNKAAVSPLTVGKLLVFLNTDATDSLMTTIAQRHGNSYCEKKDKLVSEGRYESPSRYERLNITRRTLEFRIFRGNLRAERVMKNIEFCIAAVAFCADSGIRDVSQPERFLAWLGERKRDYPALTAFLREKSVLASKPAKKENSPCV